MRTAPSTEYTKYLMHPEFLDAVSSEPKGYDGDEPFGFCCIDAPTCIATGSVHSYELSLYKPGSFITMPSWIVRGEA